MQSMPYHKNLFWNVMLTVVLFTCILFAKIETSCYTIQNVEWSDTLVDTNDVLQCVYSKQTNDVEENLSPTIFYVIDPTIIFCKLQHAWNGHAPQLNILWFEREALNVNII